MPDPLAPNLIIAGTTRAATTAVFDWLGAHPDVARSSIKEARFFLSEDPHARRLHTYQEGLKAYDAFFPGAEPGQTRLEATPEYLYDAEAAFRVSQALPEARVVMILREPVSRLVSWHRYAQQQGLLDAELSLDDYVAQMQAVTDARPPQPLRALEQGRYSAFLPSWLSAIPRRHLRVLNYRQVVDRPREAVGEVCELAGLDASFYDDFDFQQRNASVGTRLPGLQRAMRDFAWRLKPWVHDRPALRRPLRVVRRSLQRVLLNSGDSADVDRSGMSESTRAFLEDYYADEPIRLAALLERESWSWS